MRLFVAIPFDDAFRAALVRMQREMRRQHVPGRYTPPENLHLTLAFIGEYPDPDAALDALPEFAPFELRLSGFGCFGDLWWAGVADCPALGDYARRLRRALAEAGIPFDRKRFSPHITLARRAEGRPALCASEAAMAVGRVALMRSDRGKAGMIYTELGGVRARE